MKDQLDKTRGEVLKQTESSDVLEKLNGIRVVYLGKKGELTNILKSMKSVAPEERPKVGQTMNEAREIIGTKLEGTMKGLTREAREEQMKKEIIDVTLPTSKNSVGCGHPNAITPEEVERTFIDMGYGVVEGPGMEYDEYSFERLDVPANHLTRDEWDAFYINKEMVLRTQTFPVQARVTEQGRLPIRMIVPGRVFHFDEVDATHSLSFHQTEGLVIDKNITFADLKGALTEFAKELFGEDTRMKSRPYHFPFIKPNAEADMTCFKCSDSGCWFCKGSGWIEILGCDMVYPHVLEIYGIGPGEYTGFASGAGLGRIAPLKYEIDDMRLLYENDICSLK